MQINRVLVPIDFSNLSRLALNHAVVVARKFQSRLTLLHVVELTNALSFAEMAATEREHHEQSRRMLEALISPENRKDLDLSIIVKSGEVEDEIFAAIRQDHTDLLVMGTHGRGLVGRWLIGSTTQKMLRRVDIPILTVCRATQPLSFGKILLATDLSDESQNGSRIALELAETTRAELIALHATEVGVDGGAEAAVYLSEERLADARVDLNQFRKRAAQKNVKVQIVLKEGEASGAILKAAKLRSADLIVLTIQKDEGMRENIVGPTAERVIRGARIPVLTIPTPAAAELRTSEESPAA